MLHVMMSWWKGQFLTIKIHVTGMCLTIEKQIWQLTLHVTVVTNLTVDVEWPVFQTSLSMILKFCVIQLASYVRFGIPQNSSWWPFIEKTRPLLTIEDKSTLKSFWSTIVLKPAPPDNSDPYVWNHVTNQNRKFWPGPIITFVIRILP